MTTEGQQEGQGLMTVQMLMNGLSCYPPDTPVCMEVEFMEWRAIARLDGPLDNPEDAVQASVSLVRGDQL